MNIRTHMILLLLLLSGLLRGQDLYPQNDFRPPVRSTLLLSGTFGELRPNHFHSGIDIKGSVGDPLYAAADGYVSRIKVESGGYGNALYIDHPNGFTSVYAHMDEFAPEVENYVASIQRSGETFEVDAYPEPGQFVFKQGAKIGEMGVSGRSFGPHVHFEIRNTKTEKPVNPLLFGLTIADDVRPRMHELRVYTLNKKHETSEARSLSLVKKGRGYGIKGDTLTVNGDKAGLGIKVYDHMNGLNNWNGIYAIELLMDDSLLYQFTVESFSFAESRYINAHLDYEEQVSKNSYFQRCFLLPGNGLSMYSHLINRGVLSLDDRRAHKININAVDLAGNEAQLEFWLRKNGTGEANVEKAAYNYILPYDEESMVETGSLNLHFEAGSFYEDLYLNYDSHEDPAPNVYSWVHQIHDFKTPVHKYFDLAILPTTLPEALHGKAIIVYCTDDNKLISYGGKWEDGRLKASVRALGDYRIMVDETPPTIEALNFRPNLRGASSLSFKITDDFVTGGEAEALRFRATVDGQWILMKYDAKKDRITHYFDGTIPAGRHELRLVVIDGSGNEAVFDGAFER